MAQNVNRDRTIEEEKVIEQMTDEELVEMFAAEDLEYGFEAERERELKIEILKRMQSEWVSVRDRLPEIPDYLKYEDYLVTDGEELGREAVFHRDETWSWDDAKLEPVDYEITHWMPLPKPPREQFNA